MYPLHPVPVDRAIDPDRLFTSEARRWWEKEMEAYGSSPTCGFEAFCTSIPDPLLDGIFKTLNTEGDFNA